MSYVEDRFEVRDEKEQICRMAIYRQRNGLGG